MKNRFHVKSKISEGGFSKVYLGKDLLTKQDVIVKVNAKKDMNDHEFEVMKEISGTKGFPIVYDSGVYTN